MSPRVGTSTIRATQTQKHFFMQLKLHKQRKTGALVRLTVAFKNDLTGASLNQQAIAMTARACYIGDQIGSVGNKLSGYRRCCCTTLLSV
jgi:hypothetical protein